MVYVVGCEVDLVEVMLVFMVYYCECLLCSLCLFDGVVEVLM